MLEACVKVDPRIENACIRIKTWCIKYANKQPVKNAVFIIYVNIDFYIKPF